MVIPTPQDISQIIEKLEALKSRKSDFWKTEGKKVEIAAESLGLSYDRLSGEELNEKMGDADTCYKGKSVDELYGAVVWAAVKGQELTPELWPKSGKVPSADEIRGGVRVFLENRLRSFSTSELRGLLVQVILPLYRSDEIQITDEEGRRTKEGKRLDSLRDAARSELKRQIERAPNLKAQEQALREAHMALTTIRLLGDGWPPDIQCLIDEIDLLLCPYGKFLKANGSWGEVEQKIIEAALKSPEADDVAKVIHELKKVKHKMELEVGQKQTPQGEARQGETALTDYRALDLAKRTVTVGARTHTITSEAVWEFLKDLCSALRDDRLVPMLDGGTNNKNSVDQLRRQIGKAALHKLILFIDGGYRLNPEVKILNGAQIGIRRTRTGRKPKRT